MASRKPPHKNEIRDLERLLKEGAPEPPSPEEHQRKSRELLTRIAKSLKMRISRSKSND